MWLYEKGKYDHLRRDLQSVQCDTLIIESDVNQSISDVTRKILQIAMSNVPNEAITIRTNDCPWITNDIKYAIRKKNRHRTRAKHSKSVLDCERSVILVMSARLKLGMHK